MTISCKFHTTGAVKGTEKKNFFLSSCFLYKTDIIEMRIIDIFQSSSPLPKQLKTSSQNESGNKKKRTSALEVNQYVNVLFWPRGGKKVFVGNKSVKACRCPSFDFDSLPFEIKNQTFQSRIFPFSGYY